MAETEWVLSYSGTSVTLGKSTSDAFFTSAPEVGPAGLRSEDTPRPRSDGMAFGQDYFDGRTITFKLGCGLTYSEADGLTAAARLQTAWRADAVRKTPGAVASLRANTAGRNRIVYGRPRRFAPLYKLAHQGYVECLSTFDTVDDVFYGATVSTQDFTGAGTVVVGGELPSWVRPTFHGPWVNPSVTIGGWTLGFNDLTLAGGETVACDSRPWVRTIKKNTGASLAHKLKPSSRLSRASLSPGSHGVSLGGTPGSDAKVSLAWQTSHPSL